MFTRFPPLIRVRLWSWTVLALFVAVNSHAALEDEIRAFEAKDAAQPPPRDAVLFTGSSSLRVWPALESAFPGHTVLNRGFGGSQMSDLLNYFNRVVMSYRPALVVVYEGDNDLAAGESVDQIYGEYTNFLGRVERQLPGTDVALMAVKPSPSRAKYLTPVRQLNERLKTLADGRHIRFIDVCTPLLNRSGQPRPEFYQSDQLHLNLAGYAVWREVVGPVLDAWALGRGRTFLPEENSLAPGTAATGTVPPPQQGTFLIDFGGSSTTSKGAAPDDPVNTWNNVTESVGASSAGVLANLVTSGNEPSPISLVMVRRFNGANLNGTTAATLFPADATRDSLYGNTALFGGLSNVFPSFKFTGLSPALAYQLAFYASRTGVTDVRETAYTVSGASTNSVSLDAANNLANSATLGNVAPTITGDITVSLAPTARNNNANHFTYLGAMKLVAVAPPCFLPPTLTGDRIRIAWTGDGRLEAAAAIGGPWSLVVPDSSPYFGPLISHQPRFFRLRSR